LPGGKYGKAKWLAAMLFLRLVENRSGTQSRAEGVCRSRETDLGGAKRLESSVRGDKMLINKTEWLAMVAGRRSKLFPNGNNLPAGEDYTRGNVREQ
jgi:hypothetical protein